LKNGKKIYQPVYDFKTHCRLNKKIIIKPKKLIIVEGLFPYLNYNFLSLYNLKIYLDIPLDICLLRRIRRDIKERRRNINSIYNQYINSVRPMFFKFVIIQKKFADLIINEKNLLNFFELMDQKLNLKL